MNEIAIAAFSAAGAAVTACLLLLRRRNVDDGRIKALQAELAASKQVAAAMEGSFERRLQDKDAACEALLRAKDEATAKILAEKDAALAGKDADCRKMLDEKNAEIAKFLKEKEASFAAAVEVLREKFTSIAAEQMKANSEGLFKANRANLDILLAPVRDQVKLLQEIASKARKETGEFGASMAKDVLDMGNIAKKLQNVAAALASDTRFQGRKGEDVLAEKLRQAGLEEGVNFFLQRGTETDRPDAQVCDTENRWLVIDSKVSLTAYMEYVSAADEASRAEKLALHVASVRQKIDQLARKKYPEALAAENRDRNYLPVTAMFVPYEAPLMEALKAEPSLWQRAAENNVVLVTPLTLLAYLRLVYLAWQHEKEVCNQRKIVETARELLSRINNFLKTFEDIGGAIAELSEKYERAKGLFLDAPRARTIANSAHKLIDLHVRLESRKGRRQEIARCLEDENFEEEVPSPADGTRH